MQRVWLAIVAVCGVGSTIAATAQELPRATQLPSKPYFIKKTWTIGGEGNWDYLTLDPNALQLFVAHGTSVQVVDINAGKMTGQINGIRDAHGIALDDTGEAGFISDGGANRVRIFDRRSLQITASASTGPNPRAIVYEPLTKLVFAICSEPVTEAVLARLAGDEPQQPSAPGGPNGVNQNTAGQNSTGQGRTEQNAPGRNTAARNSASHQQSGAQQQANAETISVISVIDSSNNKTLGHLLLAGHLGFAITDGRGEIYVNVIDRNRIAHFNAQSALGALQRRAADNQQESVAVVDWSGNRHRDGSVAESHVSTLRLSPECRAPKSLAIDGQQMRLFAACDNQKLQVLNSGTGDVVATLTIGPGTDAIGYDAGRGLIYTANGGGLGSLTVIRRDVADGYAVIQDLPTKQRARTLAVNPTNGEVYLVTNLEGFDLNRKGDGGSAHALPVVQAAPVHGSFQVLVVGN